MIIFIITHINLPNDGNDKQIITVNMQLLYRLIPVIQAQIDSFYKE